MIEIIDQSQNNNDDTSVPAVFRYRCSLCGAEFRTTSRARAENAHRRCQPGAREDYAARQAKIEKARAKAAAAEADVSEAPKKRRGRPRKVAVESETT